MALFILPGPAAADALLVPGVLDILIVRTVLDDGEGPAQPLVLAPPRRTPRPPKIAPPILTPNTQRIEALILRTAACGEPMPTNIGIVDILNGPGRETVRRSLLRLVALKRIVVEHKRGLRRVRMVVTKQWTGWGDFPAGTHAPYSLHPRSAGAAPRRAALPYVPLVVVAEVAVSRALVDTRPARSCQWPDCAAVSIRRTSYCFEHGRTIYPSWDREAPPDDGSCG